MALAAFLAIFALKLPFPAIVIGAGALGWVLARWLPQHLGGGAAHAAIPASYGPALIDDDTPTPAHARFSRGRLLAVASAGLALWALPLALLAAWNGVQGTATQMAWFFTKAALLTFGGAYAVLPYVFQAAVGTYGWVTAAQMIDGLALGETTPGPLIMVVAFVAFVGGFGAADLVALTGSAAAAGVLAALLVTWFTFLPSFVFILAGGPLVETTHGKLAFTGPLTAITAAVVGVVVNLALFFGWHVLWPRGWAGGFDAMAAAITLAAAIALMRFDRGVVEVIAGCAAVGLAVHLLR